MPEKLSHEADPKNVPDVVYVSAMELKPKRVGIGLIVGAIILVIGIGGAYFITNFVLTDATPAPSVETKKASPSATTATPSAQKNETAGWKTLTGSTQEVNADVTIKFSFKYPPKFKILNDGGQMVVTNDQGETAPTTEGTIEAFARVAIAQEKPTIPTSEFTLGGKQALRGEGTNTGRKTLSYFVDSVVSKEGNAVKFAFFCAIPVEGSDSEKLCDQIASTFKFD